MYVQMNKVLNEYILSVNCGTSSLKFALFRADEGMEMELSGEVNGIGSSKSRCIIHDKDGVILTDDIIAHPDSGRAVKWLIKWLKANSQKYRVKAIGHRIIQCGVLYKDHQNVTTQLINKLRPLVSLAPNHLPDELNTLTAFARAFPDIPQAACFDTIFHKDMPFYSRYFSLPRAMRKEGLIRYGFHGLSCEYVMQKLKQLSPREAGGKVLIAHLGNGSSITAVHKGKSIDTTMGLTPTGGLIMGTRSGDFDPGIVLYLLKEKKMPAGELSMLLNHRSGLKGISGISPDMLVLLEKEKTNPHAKEAIAMYCYSARKFIGSLSASLEGLNCLVFTGGIGENSAAIRSRICNGLKFLGIKIDNSRNTRHKEVISSSKSSVTVRVIRTNEALIIAKHTFRLTL